jgi:hypothetical protein
MPFVLIFFALVLLVTGFRGTTGQLFTLLEEDFVSSDGFLPWALAILGIGAIGYIPKIKHISDAFLGLVVLVMLLANRSFFGNLSTAFSSAGTSSASGAPSVDTTASPTTANGLTTVGTPDGALTLAPLTSTLQTLGVNGGGTGLAPATTNSSGNEGETAPGDFDVSISSNASADNLADEEQAAASLFGQGIAP